MRAKARRAEATPPKVPLGGVPPLARPQLCGDDDGAMPVLRCAQPLR
jgi:hypothetical protein